MTSPNSRSTSPDPAAASREARVRDVARRAWDAMTHDRVSPTPRNFELWFARAEGANPALNRRLEALLEGGAVPTAEALEALHAGCSGPEPNLDAALDGTEAIQQAAQALLAQVSGNGEELRHYGDTLTHWAGELRQNQTLDGLMRAATTLSTATSRAMERNRGLEQQLSTSAARIAKLKGNLAAVQREATTDALTGLHNRKAFDARLRRAAARARTSGAPLSAMMLDVDHFKRVNDTYGHQTGDLVLRLIGRLLGETVRECDTAARYGGEEFAVVLAGADLEAGAAIAERVRATLEGKRLVRKGSVEGMSGVTISVGVAQMGPDEAATALLERADAALYRAKRLGRNRVCAGDEPALAEAAG